MSNNYHSSGGISFLGLLTIVFITLKLLGKIGWSWWWVLSPILIPIYIIVTIILIVIIIASIKSLFKSNRRKNDTRKNYY